MRRFFKESTFLYQTLRFIVFIFPLNSFPMKPISSKHFILNWLIFYFLIFHKISLLWNKYFRYLWIFLHTFFHFISDVIISYILYKESNYAQEMKLFPFKLSRRRRCCFCHTFDRRSEWVPWNRWEWFIMQTKQLVFTGTFYIFLFIITFNDLNSDSGRDEFFNIILSFFHLIFFLIGIRWMGGYQESQRFFY